MARVLCCFMKTNHQMQRRSVKRGYSSCRVLIQLSQNIKIFDIVAKNMEKWREFCAVLIKNIARCSVSASSLDLPLAGVRFSWAKNESLFETITQNLWKLWREFCAATMKKKDATFQCQARVPLICRYMGARANLQQPLDRLYIYGGETEHAAALKQIVYIYIYICRDIWARKRTCNSP